MNRTIAKMVMITAIALSLAVRTACAHGSGYWGPEIQRDPNEMWSLDIAAPVKNPHAQLLASERKLQRLWDNLTSLQKGMFTAQQREWIKEKDALGTDADKLRVVEMRVRRIERVWSQYGS
jgi:hypothetical protein